MKKFWDSPKCVTEDEAKAIIQKDALAPYAAAAAEVEPRPGRGVKRRSSGSSSSSRSSLGGDTTDDELGPAHVAKVRSAERAAKKQRTADIAAAAAKAKQAKDQKAASVFPFLIDAVDRGCSFVNLLTLIT